MRRVVVLGGGGFVGAHLCHRLAGGGHLVTAVDAGLSWGPPERAERVRRAAAWRRARLLEGVEVLDGDVRDGRRLAALLLERAPEVVVHLANVPLAAWAERRPAEARAGIVAATASVLRALPPSARLVYVSSSMVYGDFASEPMPEDGPCRPLGIYGRLKLEAERLVLAAAPDRACVVRPSAVFGEGDGHGRIVDLLRDAAAEGRPLTVDDPEARLDFTWVQDLAEGLARAALLPLPGAVLNLARGEARSLAEAAAIVGATLVRSDRPQVRPRRGALDVARARALIGYAPSVGLEEGLGRLAGGDPAGVIA